MLSGTEFIVVFGDEIADHAMNSFQWTMRILGFILLFVFCVANLVRPISYLSKAILSYDITGTEAEVTAEEE